MPIKTVDFQKISAIQAHYGKEWGEYDYETDTIKLSNKLGDTQIPSKLEVLLHEKCHQMIYKRGVKKYFTTEQEEHFCDLWTIMTYPRKRISGLEELIRSKMERGLRIKRASDRPGIIKRMLEFCGVKPTPALVSALL